MHERQWLNSLRVWGGRNLNSAFASASGDSGDSTGAISFLSGASACNGGMTTRFQFCLFKWWVGSQVRKLDCGTHHLSMGVAFVTKVAWAARVWGWKEDGPEGPEGAWGQAGKGERTGQVGSTRLDSA